MRNSVKIMIICSLLIISFKVVKYSELKWAGLRWVIGYVVGVGRVRKKKQEGKCLGVQLEDLCP